MLNFAGHGAAGLQNQDLDIELQDLAGLLEIVDWNRLRTDGRMGYLETMNTEIPTLIGIGVALLGVQGLLFRWLRQDIQGLRRDIEALRTENREIESRFNDRIEALDIRFNTGLVNLTTRIDGVNSRMDALYQALFSRKDPAA